MDENKLIRLSGIAEQSLVNGKGMRKVLFSQGCNHHCKNCFNPDTWSFDGGKLIDADKLISQIIEESFYLDGVTFSGGDPFQQPEPFAYIAKKLKQKNINIWSYTGYKFEELLELSKNNIHVKDMLNNIDVIVDGEFIEELCDNPPMKYRGSSNQRVIDVQRSLKENKIIEIIFK